MPISLQPPLVHIFNRCCVFTYTEPIKTFRWGNHSILCFLAFFSVGSFLSGLHVSLLKAGVFARELSNRPNQHQVAYVLEGLRYGFRLSQRWKLKSVRKNKSSAHQYVDVIDHYLAKNISLGRVAASFSSLLFSDLQVSSFGVIPKKGQPGKWRLIVDLSLPGGSSVNNGINPEDFALQYITVNQIITIVSKYGSGALMGKLDVKVAYRNIAVHPSDCYFLGISSRNYYFVDLTIPVGLHSALYTGINSVANMNNKTTKIFFSCQCYKKRN